MRCQEGATYNPLRAVDGLQALRHLLRAIRAVVVYNDDLEAQLPARCQGSGRAEMKSCMRPLQGVLHDIQGEIHRRSNAVKVTKRQAWLVHSPALECPDEQSNDDAYVLPLIVRWKEHRILV